MVKWGHRRQWSVLSEKGGGGKTSWRGFLNPPWRKSRVSPGQPCGHLGTESAGSAMSWPLRHPGSLEELQESVWLQHMVWEAVKAVKFHLLWAMAWNFHGPRQLERRWRVWTRLSFGEDHRPWHEGCCGKNKQKNHAQNSLEEDPILCSIVVKICSPFENRTLLLTEGPYHLSALPLVEKASID